MFLIWQNIESPDGSRGTIVEFSEGLSSHGSIMRDAHIRIGVPDRSC